MINKDLQSNLEKYIDGDITKTNWKSWKWQVKNTIRDIRLFEKLLDIKFDENKKNDYKAVFEKFPLSITPYYLSLIDKDNFENDPIFLQSFPKLEELITNNAEMSDPLAEDSDSPVPFITHRYPDRILFCISNTCAMYCRHCTRKRKVGDVDSIPEKNELLKGIEYIAKHPEVRDVLLSGGDPLMLSDNYLEWILAKIRDIPHVEIIRIGTRIPAVLPFRVTHELVAMLKKYHPLFINVQFNHPREITTSAKAALALLSDAGIPLGNQAVLLAGINDCPKIIKSLCHKMLKTRVRPYYLYQCDLSEGLSHFRTPVGKGIEIIESMIGHTTGMAVPTYVIDAPGGGGKIPISPTYLISWSTNKVVLRNYEGIITTYKEPDSYEQIFCNRKCDDCVLDLHLDESDESSSIGIEKLLCDDNSTISLIPENTERIDRRED